MKLSEIGVKRPVTAIMVFFAILILGYISYTMIPVDMMPEIESPTVSVFTTWDGASPEDMETKVTRLMESVLGGVTDLDEITSQTREGRSRVSCKFRWGTELGEASNDMRDLIERAKRRLPDEADDPVMFKFNSANMPIMFYGITARENREKMYDIVNDEIVDVLKRVSGVGSVEAFGGFQRMLRGFPAETLHETIPNFHNTPDRYRKFRETLAADPLGRAREVRAEIAFFLRREEDGAALQRMRESGALPLRVTHNDTKLNNVMLDARTRRALCVIDLDTVMPGLAAYDFGDSIRFGASTGAEDERDLARIALDLGLYETFTRGFVRACGEMDAAERESLPFGAKIMTLECGLRFLTDYLDGDHYFSIARPAHNLDRARTQIRLVEDMERKWDAMQRIVRDCT